MARGFLKCAIAGRERHDIARFDRASASVAGERTRLRRSGVTAICDG
jgi:hypothetical protein